MDAFNPQVLRAVLAARHLTMRIVSERIGVTEQDLRHEIDTGPSQRTINELSTQLAVPSFVFYMDHAPRLGVRLESQGERANRRARSITEAA